MTNPDIEQLQEHKTDLSDRATASEMLSLHYALADAQRAMKRDQEPDADGVYAVLDCVDCGNDIGVGRLAAAIKNTLCINCAAARERRR